MKRFPTVDQDVLEPMLNEIQESIFRHLGFVPVLCALIVSDGDANQTWFGGSDKLTTRDLCEELLKGAWKNHRDATREGTGIRLRTGKRRGH